MTWCSSSSSTSATSTRWTQPGHLSTQHPSIASLKHSFNLFRVNEFGVSAEMLEKKEVEGPVVDQDTSAVPAIEGPGDPEGDEGVQEAAPKAAKPKSKKAKKVD